jgi:hypothetical protein
MDHLLLRTLQVLNDSRICAAARVLSDGRIEVWLGDAEHGIRGSAMFEPTQLDQAARWLSDNAVKFFPESRYARVSRLISVWVMETIRHTL